jgi:hypothetical protein
MPRAVKHHGVRACPQCEFKFRGRPDDHLHASPFAKKVFRAVLLIMFPTLLAIAYFFAYFRDEKGRVIYFDGIENTIMLMMFTPSLLMYVWYLLIPKMMTYRCPQCSWEITYQAGTVPQLNQHAEITAPPPHNEAHPG